MAKVTYRIPSKKVVYGYIEITGDPGDFGITDTADAHGIAQAYTQYVAAFQRSEMGTVAAVSPQAPEPTVDELLRDELGAREISSTTNKPWENKPAAGNDKPWASKAAPASDDDWDI